MESGAMLGPFSKWTHAGIGWVRGHTMSSPGRIFALPWFGELIMLGILDSTRYWKNIFKFS